MTPAYWEPGHSPSDTPTRRADPLCARRFVALPLGLRIVLVVAATAILAVGAGSLVGHTLGPLPWR